MFVFDMHGDGSAVLADAPLGYSGAVARAESSVVSPSSAVVPLAAAAGAFVFGSSESLCPRSLGEAPPAFRLPASRPEFLFDGSSCSAELGGRAGARGCAGRWSRAASCGCVVGSLGCCGWGGAPRYGVGGCLCPS